MKDLSKLKRQYKILGNEIRALELGREFPEEWCKILHHSHKGSFVDPTTRRIESKTIGYSILFVEKSKLVDFGDYILLKIFKNKQFMIDYLQKSVNCE